MPVPGIAAGLAAVRLVAGIVGKGSKNVNPVYRQMEVPKAPPGGKPFNPNPPKPPTSSSIPKKEPHVSENRTSSYKLPKVSKPVSTQKNPTKNKGPFSGDIARYNWTGK